MKKIINKNEKKYWIAQRACNFYCITHYVIFSSIHAKKTRLKITQLDKVRFIKLNEIKLTQVELFSFFFILNV